MAETDLPQPLMSGECELIVDGLLDSELATC